MKAVIKGEGHRPEGGGFATIVVNGLYYKPEQIVWALANGPPMPEPEIDPDILAVRAILHAAQRAVPNDYPWGDMSYIKGSYDHLDAFKAALETYRKQKKGTAT